MLITASDKTDENQGLGVRYGRVPVPVPKIVLKSFIWSQLPWIFTVYYYIEIDSVADPWHFGVDLDLDPRIHASD